MFKPGIEKVEGSGRKKGVPNKASLKMLDQLIAKNINPIEKVLALLESPTMSESKKLDAWIKILSYCYPTLKAIEVSGQDGTVIGVTPDNVALLCKIAREEALANMKDKETG